MYGLPANFDASRLVGCRLEQVCFSANTAHFAFDQEVCITIESCFSYTTVDTGRSDLATVPIRESAVMQLIGQSVELAYGSPDGSLTLVFANRHSLVCHDDSTDYESYRLKIGDEEIVV